jgi:hypothetical protein
MDARFTPPQFEFPRHLRAARPTGDGVNQSSLEATIMRPSLARRALRGPWVLAPLWPGRHMVMQPER